LLFVAVIVLCICTCIGSGQGSLCHFFLLPFILAIVWLERFSMLLHPHTQKLTLTLTLTLSNAHAHRERDTRNCFAYVRTSLGDAPHDSTLFHSCVNWNSHSQGTLSFCCSSSWHIFWRRWGDFWQSAVWVFVVFTVRFWTVTCWSQKGSVKCV